MSNYSRKLEVVSVAVPVVNVLVLAATAEPVEAAFPEATARSPSKATAIVSSRSTT